MKPVKDKILEIASFEKFLQERIKVRGNAGGLGDSVNVTCDKSDITVTSDRNFIFSLLFGLILLFC
jgi:large subunit ribosomal protein L22e